MSNARNLANLLGTDTQIQTADIANSAVTTAKVADAAFQANKNLIINGAMQVWQRSISSTSAGWGYYTADRWNTTLRDGAGTMSQYDMGSELQPFVYAFKTAMTSAATTSPVIQQKIEDSRRFKNQTVTFSFYAKASKAITVDTVFDLLWANSSNGTTAQSNSITTSWQRFTYTVTLPNPSGTYNATYDHLYCRFSLPTSDTYDFYITGVQLEVGSTATPFEHRSYGDELARCQRYYCKTYNDGVNPGTVTTNGNVMNSLDATQSYAKATWDFPITMRTAPTIVLYNPNNGTSGQVAGDAGNYSGSTGYIGTNRMMGGVSGVSLSTSVYLRFHATADAEL